MDERTEEIAREAARLISKGDVEDLNAAIATAAQRLGLQNAPSPGRGRVRQHVRAMSMQAMGEAAYRGAVREMRRVAEEMMTMLEEAFDDARTLLVGRAAKGQIDAGVTLHIRIYTEASISDIADVLVQFGYEEPSFETAETRHGRLSRVRLTDDGWEIVLTRCMPDLYRRADIDLFTGRRQAVATVADVRREMAE
jgi:hypothetical protein